MHDLLHRLKSRPSRSAAMPPSSSSVLTSEEHSTHSPFCAPSSIGDNSPNKSHQAPTKIRTHRRRSQVSAHASHVPSCPVTPRVSSVSTREPHLQSSETSSHLIHSRQSPPANTILRPNYANRCKFRLHIGTPIGPCPNHAPSTAPAPLPSGFSITTPHPWKSLW